MVDFCDGCSATTWSSSGAGAGANFIVLIDIANDGICECVEDEGCVQWAAGTDLLQVCCVATPPSGKSYDIIDYTATAVKCSVTYPNACSHVVTIHEGNCGNESRFFYGIRYITSLPAIQVGQIVGLATMGECDPDGCMDG